MFGRHFFLRCLIGIVLFFALMILIPYVLGLIGLHVPDQIVRLCIGITLLGYAIWGPPVPGISA